MAERLTSLQRHLLTNGPTTIRRLEAENERLREALAAIDDVDNPDLHQFISGVLAAVSRTEGTP